MSRAWNSWQGMLAMVAMASIALLADEPASAAGTHSSENMILATAPLDGSAEMIISLDIVSGTLTGHVMNTTSRKFFGTYQIKTVATDLGVPRGKNPKYTMVTGLTGFKPGGAGQKLGACVIYIAEENSGNLAAYGVQWEANWMNNPGKRFALPFVKLDMAKVAAGGAKAGGAAEVEKE